MLNITKRKVANDLYTLSDSQTPTPCDSTVQFPKMLVQDVKITCRYSIFQIPNPLIRNEKHPNVEYQI